MGGFGPAQGTVGGILRGVELPADLAAFANGASIYPKDDGFGVTKYYVRWSDGTVLELGAGGGPGSDTTALHDGGDSGYGPVLVAGSVDDIPVVFIRNNVDRLTLDGDYVGVGAPSVQGSPAFELDVGGRVASRFQDGDPESPLLLVQSAGVAEVPFIAGSRSRGTLAAPTDIAAGDEALVIAGVAEFGGQRAVAAIGFIVEETFITPDISGRIDLMIHDGNAGVDKIPLRLRRQAVEVNVEADAIPLVVFNDLGVAILETDPATSRTLIHNAGLFFAAEDVGFVRSVSGRVDVKDGAGTLAPIRASRFDLGSNSYFDIVGGDPSITSSGTFAVQFNNAQANFYTKIAMQAVPVTGAGGLDLRCTGGFGAITMNADFSDVDTVIYADDGSVIAAFDAGIAGGGLGFFNAPAVAQQASSADLTDNVGGTVADTLDAIPDPADAPVTADSLRDDLVANVLPEIRDSISSLRAKVNKALGVHRNFGLMA